MNPLDIFFIAVVAFFFFRGLFRGLVQEISSIVGLILGFFLANTYYERLVPSLEKLINNPDYAAIASYLLIFFGTMFGVLLVSVALRSLLRLAMLGWLDRVGGGGLGLLKATLICSITLLILTTFMPSDTGFIRQSRLAPYINQMNKSIVRLMPSDLKERFRDKLSEFDSFWDKDWIKKRKPQG
ncbi:MAG: CvpA family protein [Desulfonatronovibrionaceae bacterium]